MVSPHISAPVARRPRAARTWKGRLLRAAFWIALIGIFTSALAAASGWRPWPVVTPPRQTTKVINWPADPLAAAARRAARSVVTIQTVGKANTRNLGAGFVVEGGLIATNFHVVSSATEAQARFADGRIFAITGYAAADPEHDLALLRLQEPPADIVALPFVEGPPPVASQLMAIGHPRGVEFAFVEGRLSQRVRMDDLPEDGQRFVRKLASAADDIRWIQHTATLAEGNSGGPLIDSAGRVVGINTWINRASNLNYALESSLLIELARQVSTETQPLETLARSDLQASLVASRLTGQRVEALAEQAEQMSWLPATSADYRVLSELAMAMTVAQLPQSFAGDKSDEARTHELQTATTRVENQLRAKPQFGSPDQITIVNEQAARVLSKAHNGLFFFAEVQRVVEGDGGRRGMLMKLIGDDQPLFISLDGQLLHPKNGQVFAVFGANLKGDVVRYGDNPLQLITAPVVVSRTLIEISN